MVSSSEPVSLDGQQIYRALSDADATAATAFLSGGLEPIAARHRYQADIAQAASRLEAATAIAGHSAAARGLAALSAALPVYAGEVETARADNRLGLPLGAAYLREAASLGSSQPGSLPLQSLPPSRIPLPRRIRIRPPTPVHRHQLQGRPVRRDPRTRQGNSRTRVPATNFRVRHSVAGRWWELSAPAKRTASANSITRRNMTSGSSSTIQPWIEEGCSALLTSQHYRVSGIRARQVKYSSKELRMGLRLDSPGETIPMGQCPAAPALRQFPRLMRRISNSPYPGKTAKHGCIEIRSPKIVTASS